MQVLRLMVCVSTLSLQLIPKQVWQDKLMLRIVCSDPEFLNLLSKHSSSFYTAERSLEGQDGHHNLSTTARCSQCSHLLLKQHGIPSLAVRYL